MSKKQSFLTKLENNLQNSKYKSEIISKYDFLIEQKLGNGKKITDIIKSIGNPEEISEKEISIYKKKENSLKIFNKVKDKFINYKMKIKAFFDKIKLKMKKRKKIKTRIEKVKFNKKIELSKYKILIIILQIILILILFCTLILFATSLIAILDNVKIYGVALLMFSVSSFFGFLVILLDRKLYGLKTNHSLTFIVFITLMVMMSLGVGYTSYDYFKIDFVNDISEKYSMSHETFNYKFYKNKNLNIHFNSWYKNTYIIEFDNALENSVKIDVKYYKSFYDLNSKNEGSNIYISLANDIRDVTSMYLENLKENKIYNEKELSRYTIKIYVSEENYERLVIFN